VKAGTRDTVDDVAVDDGEALRALARLLAPGAGRSSPPPLPRWIVRRQGALARLVGPPDVACILVDAPAGYGKTTILATLADDDERPCAWLTLGRTDDDPTALLAHLLLALDQIEPMATDAFEQVLLSDADLATVRLPRFAKLVERIERPFLLAVDDAHQLATRDACDVIRVLVEHVPPGASVAIATRDASRLGIGRARAGGRVLDLETRDLAMSVDEGTRLLRGCGLDVAGDQAAGLVEKTEGWPAGLYLCTLALRDASPTTIGAMGGRDRLVAEYLGNEMLSAATADQVEFMLHTSILDRLSGPMCEAVLARADAGSLLEELAHGNYLIVPLDESGTYRYHHMFQDLLRDELERRDPRAVPDLHRRASEWFEADGDHDAAILHAHQAGDRARRTELIWRHGALYNGSGRTATVVRWLALLTNEEIASEPALAITAAWSCFTGGSVDELEAWLAFAERAVDDELPDGAPVGAAVALLRALVARDGLTAMRLDAATAYRLDRADSPYRAVASLLEGAAARLLGDPAAARVCLERAVAIGELLIPSPRVHALGVLAQLAADGGQWGEAGSTIDRALALATEFSLQERPESSLAYGAGALIASRIGDTLLARDRCKHAGWLLTALKNVTPWIAIEAHMNVARVQLFLGDVPAARASVAVASRMLAGFPDPGLLPDLLSEVKRCVDSAEVPLELATAPLTTAELRVLRFLPTHLSFAQIGDELFVSRNTVKTQAIAVYRKLEVSSRADAVERARSLGLLDRSAS
jgi:LuxR family maltose regulon positive regulatory protein